MPSLLAAASLLGSLALVPLLGDSVTAEMLDSPDGTRVITREPVTVVLYRATTGAVNTYQTSPVLGNVWKIDPSGMAARTEA
jgi:hypothetical protein